MKKYFSYFKFLFIVMAILSIAAAGLFAADMAGNKPKERGNTSAPQERVYDYAEVLTPEEETKLRSYIAEKEALIGADIVIVMLKESLYAKYGITADTDSNWEKSMMNYADDFYDDNKFGFDKVHGDGILLLFNWYEDEKADEKGSWLSTCGRVMDKYSNSMTDRLLDDVHDTIYTDPYAACREYVDDVYRDMSRNTDMDIQIPLFVCLIVGVIAGGIFIAMHLRTKEGNDTTSAGTYVEGRPNILTRQDELVNKFVTSRVIQTESGSDSGGGGGSHVSSGGVSHGGGGRRG